MDRIKADIVNMAEIKRNGIDENNSASLDRGELSLDAIPDLDKLTGYILEILQYLEDPSNRRLIETSEGNVRMMLNNRYAETVPYGIITLLLDKENRYENVSRLMRMFEMMNNAKCGKKSLEEVEKEFTDEINHRYIYSKYGSKEEFEKELEKEISNEKKTNGSE